jgi:hypothetical protein
MTSKPQNGASAIVDELIEKHRDDLWAIFEDFQARVAADPTLGDDVVGPAFLRLIKNELLKRGRLPH